MATSAERRHAHAAVLELLEKRHGVGLRGAAVSAWMEARLDRALDALLSDTAGDIAGALEILRSDGARLEEIADLLRVGETRFFRDPAQWEALRKVTLPALSDRERLRALSVGCSTGEEAWSLAMLLDDTLGARSGRSFRVVGMDRSESALAVAREGVYAKSALSHVPSELASRYLELGGDQMRVSDALRACVTFAARDVMVGPPAGSWEIIVCKNLLIYFGHDAAEHALEPLVRSLSEGGVLLVARSEVPRVRALGYQAHELAPGVSVFRAR